MDCTWKAENKKYVGYILGNIYAPQKSDVLHNGLFSVDIFYLEYGNVC